MTFHAFGLNHETAPVAVREAFALDEAAQRRLYGLLRLSASAEVILLSTCNRTEVYLFGGDTDVAAVQATLSATAGTPWPIEHAFALTDEAAVLHVLHVTSGLRSQVLGDEQILAQMKGAYRVAVDAEQVGAVLHRLMHTAFRTAKRVRTETALSEGAASISGLAVRAARLHFEKHGTSLAGRRVLLLGTGEMGLVALKTLAGEGAVLTVSNRSRPRAEAAAASLPRACAVRDWADRHAAVADADLVLVASGAPEPVLLANDLPERSDTAPCLVIDVAMPRNVEPAVREKDGYTLLDLDLLGLWRTQTTEARRSAAPEAEAICAEGLGEFVAWVFNHEALQPAIHALRETFEAIRTQEIERHAHRFQSADRDDLDRLTRSIMQKLLAVPVVRLKNTDSESLDFVRGVRFLSHAFSRPGCEDASPEERAAVPESAADAPDAESACPFGHTEPEAAEPEDAEADREARNARQ
ncbi:MAG: glutamyl-tRNA reductase [Rhodothermales bacterium]